VILTGVAGTAISTRPGRRLQTPPTYDGRSFASLRISAADSRFAHARCAPSVAEKVGSLYTGQFPVQGVLAPWAAMAAGRMHG